MNTITQNEIRDYLIDLKINGANETKRKAFNDKRFKRVEESLKTLPLFIPLSLMLDANGKAGVYSTKSDELITDALLYALITDNPTRGISLSRTSQQNQFYYLDKGITINGADIAGVRNDLDGKQGTFELPTPLGLLAGKTLTLEAYKPDTTPDTEYVNLVLSGETINERKQELSVKETTEIREAIQLRPNPEFSIIKIALNYSIAGGGGQIIDLKTERADEPLMILGFKTNLQASKISIKVEGGVDWTSDLCPIWGIASRTNLLTENYRMLKQPFYLPKGARITLTLQNGLNETIDGQNGNYLTVLCETM